jgi:hypothetical protein
MQLITVHKILISAGILFFLFFGIRELVLMRNTSSAMTGALALVGAIGLGIYLRWIIKAKTKWQ